MFLCGSRFCSDGRTFVHHNYFDVLEQEWYSVAREIATLSKVNIRLWAFPSLEGSSQKSNCDPTVVAVEIERLLVGIPLTQPTTTCSFGSWKTTRELSRSSRSAFRRRKGVERTWSASGGRMGFAVRSAMEPRPSWSAPPCSSAAAAGARPRPRRVRFSKTGGSRC